MTRFVARNPWITLGLVVLAACVLFGPGTVGAWIGVHGRWAILGAWRFVVALFQGAF